MKLLTNYKDYYDYLISKYGIDEKALYIRKKDQDYKVENGKIQILAICGTLIVMARIGGKPYFGFDIDKSKLSLMDRWGEIYCGISHDNLIACHGFPTTLNDKTGNPVSLVSHSSVENWD